MNSSTQNVWMQQKKALFCGDCKALRLLIWQRMKHVEQPQQALALDDYWLAVHCDYFKRRIEHPDKLLRCGAHQKSKEEK